MSIIKWIQGNGAYITNGGSTTCNVDFTIANSAGNTILVMVGSTTTVTVSDTNNGSATYTKIFGDDTNYIYFYRLDKINVGANTVQVVQATNTGCEVFITEVAGISGGPIDQILPVTLGTSSGGNCPLTLAPTTHANVFIFFWIGAKGSGNVSGAGAGWNVNDIQSDGDGTAYGIETSVGSFTPTMTVASDGGYAGAAVVIAANPGWNLTSFIQSFSATNGLTHSGSPNFQDATDSPFFPTMAGLAYVSIVGAGTSGANLDAAIISYTSASEVVLNQNAGVDISSANWTNATAPVDSDALTTITFTWPNPIAVGDAIAVIVTNYDTNTASISGGQDSVGNAYTPENSLLEGSDVRYSIFQTIATHAGTNVTLTVNLSGSSIYIEVTIFHWTPPAGMVASIGPNNISSGSGTALNSGNITTTKASSVLMGCSACEANVIAPVESGWTQQNQEWNTGGGIGDSFGQLSQTIVETSIVSNVSATCTAVSYNTYWVMGICSFQATAVSVGYLPTDAIFFGMT